MYGFNIHFALKTAPVAASMWRYRMDYVLGMSGLNVKTNICDQNNYIFVLFSAAYFHVGWDTDVPVKFQENIAVTSQ